MLFDNNKLVEFAPFYSKVAGQQAIAQAVLATAGNSPILAKSYPYLSVTSELQMADLADLGILADR